MNTRIPVATPPQEVIVAQRAADSVFAMADAYEIDSPAMFEAAGSELQSITSRIKEIEKQRVYLKEPYLEGGRRIDAFFKVPLDRFTEAANLLKQRMLSFQQAERAKAEQARRDAEAVARREREEQERQRRDAEATERQAREDAEAARLAGDTEAAAAAEAVACEAAAVVAEADVQIELAEIAPIAVPTAIAPKAAGISSRQNWKAEVVNFEQLVRAAVARLDAGDPTLLGYLMPDEKAINQVAKALKQQARIPGVRIYAADVLAVRAA